MLLFGPSYLLTNSAFRRKMIQFSRRKFLLTAGASAVGSVLLEGCVGNPPSPTDLSPKAAALDLSPDQRPETNTVKLGYIPIAEAAPLIIAQEKGFFARHGMTHVEISKQASWGSARDNVEIGSAGGGIDGGQWQLPMPHLISEGIITKGNRKIPMINLLQLSTHGNGIAISNQHLGQGIGLDVSQAADYIKGLQATASRPFTAAYTFPKANQDFWIRYWLAAGGIDPDKDIKLLAVPAAQTVANMRTGTMDAFSTGDPWPLRIVRDRVGFMAVLTSQIWKFHPEEYFALRRDWVDQHPKATKALIKAIMEAQQWCDNPRNREELVRIVAIRKYFNIPPDVLRPPYAGKYQMADSKPDINDPMMGPLYWKEAGGSVSYPYKSHELWFLTESVRWGFLPQKTLDESERIINAVNGEELWREAAQEAGISTTDIPKSTSRGVETFFDGTKFDPANPTGYLNSLVIKRV
jgi:bicarbonate transport system substrate-binding protein